MKNDNTIEMERKLAVTRNEEEPKQKNKNDYKRVVVSEISDGGIFHIEYSK